MKTSIAQEKPPAFNPVTLTLVFETHGELRGYLALFNNADSVKGLIRKQTARTDTDTFHGADEGVVDKMGGYDIWCDLKETLPE